MFIAEEFPPDYIAPIKDFQLLYMVVQDIGLY
jgi:hypothetical protein